MCWQLHTFPQLCLCGAGSQEQHFESRGNTVFKMNSKVIFVLVVVIWSTLISQGEAFHVGTGGLGKKRELNGCVEVKSILLPYGKECFYQYGPERFHEITLNDLLQEPAIKKTSQVLEICVIFLFFAPGAVCNNKALQAKNSAGFQISPT